MNTETVLVTGANGLLGTNIVLQLLEQGYNVRALVREPGSFMPFTHPQLELVKGDITLINTLKPHLQVCNYVIHSAAVTSPYLRKLSDYHPVNVNGTANIIELCKIYNIKRLVYIGTSNTLGHGSKESPGNENLLPRYPFTHSLYAQSKMIAQDLIDKAAGDTDVISLCPTFMIGPYDTKPSSGKIIQMILNKKVFFYPGGGKNFVHVRDVARAAVKALNNGKQGEKYLVCNENLSYREFFEKVKRVTGQKTILIPIADPIILSRGLAVEILNRTGIYSKASYNYMKILTVCNFYSNEKIRRELGMNFTPVDQAIKEAVDWFNQSS